MNNANVPFAKVGEIVLYTVNKGDNVYRISQMFNTDPELIRCMNKLNDEFFINTNQQLLIPILYQHMQPPHHQSGPYRQSYDLYF